MLSRRPAVTIVYGSNVNGYWFKILERGVVKHVKQLMPGSTGAAAKRTKTLPTEMPGTVFTVTGSSGNASAMDGNRTVNHWPADNTATTFTYAVRGGSSFEASAANLVAEWSAS